MCGGRFVCGRLLDRRIAFGEDREFGKLGSCYANSLETLCHNTVRCCEQCNEQIHRRDVVSTAVASSSMCIAEKSNYVVGEKFAVEQ